MEGGKAVDRPIGDRPETGDHGEEIHVVPDRYRCSRAVACERCDDDCAALSGRRMRSQLPPRKISQASDAVPEDSSEIVVTARRRNELLQDVPIAVTAYSGAQLEREGAIDITDIGDTTPNVTIETSRGTTAR
jgi:hypothetical protein